MTLPKPYYQDDAVTLYHGDCREILPHVSADVLVTDPPYGIDLPTDYRTRGRGGLARCNDYPAVHGDDQPFDPSTLLALALPSVIWGANYFARDLANKSGWLVWDKLRPPGIDQADAELAWTNFVKGVRVFRYMWHGMLRAGDEPLMHPTQKPAALMAWVLSLEWTPPGTVLDPYCGSGPVLRAAKDLGRKAIGIEIEERYCEIAARRCAQEILL